MAMRKPETDIGKKGEEKEIEQGDRIESSSSGGVAAGICNIL